MSAQLALERLELDLEGNTTTASLTLDVEELFDERGELRLWEDEEAWSGFVEEDGTYYHVDSWRDEDDKFRKIIVGERAIRLAVREHLEDEDAGGVGEFVREVEP